MRWFAMKRGLCPGSGRIVFQETPEAARVVMLPSRLCQRCVRFILDAPCSSSLARILAVSQWMRRAGHFQFCISARGSRRMHRRARRDAASVKRGSGREGDQRLS